MALLSQSKSLVEIRDELLKTNEFRLKSESEKIAYIHGVIDMYNETLKAGNKETFTKSGKS